MSNLAQFNKMIKPLGIKCLNGKGYFYFIETGEIPVEHIPDSVYVYRFNELTIEQWIECIKG